MKNITIEQLNEIISTMDLEKIKTELTALGFRNASKYGDWEFDMQKIACAEEVEGTEWHEDIFDDRKYHGDIHKKVEGYTNATFIVVSLRHIYRECEIEAFEGLYCFTDLPLNEEYESKKSQKKHCDCCKKLFTEGELCKTVIKGKELWLCDDCFKKKVAEIIKKRTKRFAKRAGRR